MALIGLSGKKQSGKDTVCKIIQYLTFLNYSKDKRWTYSEFEEEFNKRGHFHPDYDNISGWQKKMFAEKLKQIVCLLIGCTMKQLEDEKFKGKELGEEWWYYIRIDNSSGSQSKVLLPYLEWKDNLFSDKVFPTKLTPRLLLQLLGTECGRQIIHPNIWVNALMSNYRPIGVKQLFSDEYIQRLTDRKDDFCPKVDEPIYPNWIITDVRFPNEVKAIKDRDGIIIRVNRFGMIDNSTHESETTLDNYKEFDFIIDNNSNIEWLIEQTRVFLKFSKII